MATHKEVEQRRRSMLEELRLMCRGGSVPAGEPLPRARELAERFAVSQQIVGEVIRALTEEGLLYTVPRVGTFVGHQSQAVNPFLLTFPRYATGALYLRQMQIGFEDRIDQLGGVSLCLVADEAAELQRQGQLLALAGTFHAEGWSHEIFRIPGVPAVAFSSFDGSQQGFDSVQFDDFGGGRVATQHFLATGHQKIAFLGLHLESNGTDLLPWSQCREAGWKHALDCAGLPTDNLAFHPDATKESASRLSTSNKAQVAVGYDMAMKHLMDRPDITAVVAANVAVAGGLFTALQNEVTPESWPAVLCFDDLSPTSRAVTSYLRLPWDELGRQAAQILWERNNGQMTGPAQERRVPMRLVRRLTCNPEHANALLSPLLASANWSTV